MGETADILEQHGGPGRIYCLRECTYVVSRCSDCKAFAENQGYETDGCPTMEDRDERDHGDRGAGV